MKICLFFPFFFRPHSFFNLYIFFYFYSYIVLFPLFNITWSLLISLEYHLLDLHLVE